MRKDPLRWMPWDVDDWLDPDISVMHPTARAGYFDLLCWQWKIDGLPNDDEQLRLRARLSKLEWPKYKERILARFTLDDDGKYRQHRCKEEKERAINRLEEIHGKRSEAAKSRWNNANAMQLQCKTMLHNSTVQDITVHDTPPTPPRGTTTVFDQQKEVETLLAGYKAGAEPDTPDEGDEENARKAIGQVTAGLRAGGKLLFLRELSQYPPLQVCIAAKEWLELPELPRGDPKPYFLGIVRRSAAIKYTRYADKLDAKGEQLATNRRKAEAREGKPMGQPASDARHTPGFHKAGDVLRNLPEVRRACEAGGRTATEDSHDV